VSEPDASQRKPVSIEVLGIPNPFFGRPGFVQLYIDYDKAGLFLSYAEAQALHEQLGEILKRDNMRF
jgi:hypothetical protein